MIFTHEQTQALLKAMRLYREWVADSEYRAEVKNPEIMEGIIAIEKAERFIADLDAETEQRAARIEYEWDRAAEFDILPGEE